jgi:serpin B
MFSVKRGAIVKCIGWIGFFLATAVVQAPAQANSELVKSANPAHAPATARTAQMQPQQTSTAASSINTFGLKLLTDLSADKPQQNVFISPLSVFAALAMTETGSAGDTRQSIREALAVPQAEDENEFHNATSALLKSLQAQKDVTLSIANALWSDQKFSLSPDFIRQCRALYQADATTLNFNDPNAAKTINTWVDRNTKGKIPNIVDARSLRDAAAVITNAVYFKGLWAEPFEKSETQDRPFHLANGREKNVPMMHDSSIADAYRSGDGFEAAVLPYKSSNRWRPGVVLIAVLPTKGVGPEAALAGIDVGKLYASQSARLDLRLPKFTTDYSASLKPALKKLGMGVAFSGQADFKPMGSPKFYISDVLHKTRLEVDEEGRVAAAATSVGVVGSAIRLPEQTKTLVFERPFGVLLYDTRSGAILFAGVIYDPK